MLAPAATGADCGNPQPGCTPTKFSSNPRTSPVLSIDGQVRVLSEKAVGSVDEADEVAHALAMSNHFPWVDVELLYR